MILAMKLKDTFTELGWEFAYDSPTNQQFPILTPEQYERLSADFLLSYWKKMDNGDPKQL